MERFAVISDVHGNLPALEAALRDMEGRGAERAYNLGDHVSGSLWPKETLALLKASGFTHIRGNHDRSIAGPPEGMGASDAFARSRISREDLEWLNALPVRSEAALEDGGRIIAFHGSPGDDAEYLLETVKAGEAVLADRRIIEERLGGTRAALMLCGHSHIPRLVRLDDGGLVLNPGSVGMQAYFDDSPPAHAVRLGSPHARYAIVEMDGTGMRVEFRTVEYDWERAARKAISNGREDWAVLLRTGDL